MTRKNCFKCNLKSKRLPVVPKPGYVTHLRQPNGRLSYGRLIRRDGAWWRRRHFSSYFIRPMLSVDFNSFGPEIRTEEIFHKIWFEIKLPKCKCFCFHLLCLSNLFGWQLPDKRLELMFTITIGKCHHIFNLFNFFWVVILDIKKLP